MPMNYSGSLNCGDVQTILGFTDSADRERCSTTKVDNMQSIYARCITSGSALNLKMWQEAEGWIGQLECISVKMLPDFLIAREMIAYRNCTRTNSPLSASSDGLYTIWWHWSSSREATQSLSPASSLHYVEKNTLYTARSNYHSFCHHCWDKRASLSEDSTCTSTQ